MFITIYPKGFVKIEEDKLYFRNLELITLPYVVKENGEVANDKSINLMYDDQFKSPNINTIASAMAGIEIRGAACICLMAYDGHNMRWKGFSEFGMKETIKQIISDKKLNEAAINAFKKAKSSYFVHRKKYTYKD